jgi:hypothetical protein
MSDSSELDESSSKNRSLALMDEVIYKKIHQHRKTTSNLCESPGKMLTVAAPDLVDSDRYG